MEDQPVTKFYLILEMWACPHEHPPTRIYTAMDCAKQHRKCPQKRQNSTISKFHNIQVWFSKEARAQTAAHLLSIWYHAQLMEVHRLFSSKMHQTPQNVPRKQIALSQFSDE